MRIVLDIEANGLENPTKIWVIVCKDIDTGKYHIFRNLNDDEEELSRFRRYWNNISLAIGHNLLGYDYPVLNRLCNISVPDICAICVDTLVVSKMVDYSKQGHSIEDYGEEFGLEKGKFTDFSKFSEEMVEYCKRDVDICYKIYLKYIRYIRDPLFLSSFRLEHSFQYKVVNSLETNGFSFDILKANKLLSKVLKELEVLDNDILLSFPPREVVVREFTPRLTKHGTINKSSVPRTYHHRIHEFEAGKTYPLTKEVPFNPSSHKQIITVLNEAGWRPTDRTQTHIDNDREIQRLKYARNRTPELDLALQQCYAKQQSHIKTGWKVNETNLATLPESAPPPARALAKRILLEARRRTLTEWLNLVKEDGRIHGRFYGIGAWTHRMAHQNPNTANIPTGAKLYGDEMRKLWQAPRNRLLVGVDAEGIQLRIFAHYIDDPEFTEALVKGRKDDKTDPHSLNQRILGSVCRSRQAAKRCIYALLLGAGLGKIAEVLECSEAEAKEALDRLLVRYTGWQKLKKDILPRDGERGWFTGLDGRRVRIPGETAGARKHLAMSGYLQNGEAVVMKSASLKWIDKLKDFDALLVNFVHDEWQTECPNDGSIALQIAKMQADSLREVGEELKLKCPLAGSYWNDDLKDYTIGTNWKVTH